jgi:hypothetical protein
MPTLNGIHLVGLNTAFFGVHQNSRIEAVSQAFARTDVNRLASEIKSGGSYIVFTHIPDLRVPASPPKSGTLPLWSRDDLDESWLKAVAGRTEVLGVFAGHLHQNNRDAYPQSVASGIALTDGRSKLWVAPPLSELDQWRLPPEKTARGMLLVSINADGQSTVLRAGASPFSTCHHLQGFHRNIPAPVRRTLACFDASRDDTGLLLDEERLPKRVRMKKARAPQS